MSNIPEVNASQVVSGTYFFTNLQYNYNLSAQTNDLNPARKGKVGFSHLDILLFKNSHSWGYKQHSLDSRHPVGEFADQDDPDPLRQVMKTVSGLTAF